MLDTCPLPTQHISSAQCAVIPQRRELFQQWNALPGHLSSRVRHAQPDDAAKQGPGRVCVYPSTAVQDAKAATVPGPWEEGCQDLVSGVACKTSGMSMVKD